MSGIRPFARPQARPVQQERLGPQGETVEPKEGQAVIVPSGADHRFVGYENFSVLVIFGQPGKTAS